MGAAIESAAFDSYVSDDLPQLPALLTSVSNSIAGSVLPPSLGRGGASLWDGALPCGMGRTPLNNLLSPSFRVTSLIL